MRCPSVRNRHARALPPLPVRQCVADDEVRDILARHAVPVPKVPVLDRAVWLRFLAALLRARVPVAPALPVRKQRGMDDNDLPDLALLREPRCVLPPLCEHNLLDLVRARPRDAADMREDALRAELVVVRRAEHAAAVERFERERKRLVRRGGDAHRSDRDEARLRRGGHAELGGHRAEGVDQGARDEVGGLEDEAAGYRE